MSQTAEKKEVIDRECSEETNFLSCLWLFGSLLKTEHMGKPWNNESAEKWWACGRHVRQKELAPSAKVRRTAPEVVRAPPRHLLVRRRCCESKRACAVTQSCRASIVKTNGD